MDRIAGLFCCCIGDFTAVYVLALYYPDYNHFKMPMSVLGASGSRLEN